MANPTIKKGMTGSYVETIQKRLIFHGYPLPKFGVDGDFGDETERAVKDFQNDKGLAVVGYVGPKTWAALLAAKTVDKPAVIVRPGALDPRIAEMESIIIPLVGMPYVIGGQGHPFTESYVKSRAKAKPSYYTGGRLEWQLKEARAAAARGEKLICLDCSGLVWYPENRMNLVKADDTTAHRLYTDHCTPITKAEVRPGDLLFRADGATKVHVAFVGHKGTYESVGTAYGVQFDPDVFGRKRLNKMTGKIDTKDPWTHYGRLKWWE